MDMSPTVARVLVSIALLAVAAAVVVVDSDPDLHPLAIVIVSTVLGYWLGHAEATVGK